MTDPRLLRHTGHLLRRAQQVHLAAWNEHVSTTITSVQYAALAIVSGSPGASQAHLGQALGLDRSTIADLVARMERHGLLERADDPDDRRRKTLQLTEAGADALAELRPRVDAIEPIVTGGLGDADRAQLHAYLQGIIEG